jgi:hypothetical protein
VLKKFLRRAQNKFDAKVKKIRSDNGTKFKKTQVEDFLDEEGINHEFLTPYTPRIGFGWGRSTWRVMQLTASTSTSF